MWFRLAAKLHTPLQELQMKTTSSEFMEWCVFMDEEPNHFNVLHYYLAQIALEVRNSRFMSSSKSKLKDFLITFTSKGKRQDTKSTWRQILKMKSDD